MKQSTILGYGALVLLLIVGVYLSVSSFNILGEQDKVMFEEYSCSVPDDCYDSILELGFPQNELDEQLQSADLICENSICGVQRK